MQLTVWTSSATIESLLSTAQENIIKDLTDGQKRFTIFLQNNDANTLYRSLWAAAVASAASGKLETTKSISIVVGKLSDLNVICDVSSSITVEIGL